MIDTFLAKVQSVSDAAYDAQGHLRKEASITLLVYDGTSNKELTLTNGEDNYSYVKGDYVLLNAYTLPTNDSKVSGAVAYTGTEGTDYYGEIVAKAESFTGAQTIIYWNNEQHNAAGTVYDDAVKFILDEAGNSTENHTWFLDQYGSLIGAAGIAATDSYGVINRIWWVGNTADGTGATATVNGSTVTATAKKTLRSLDVAVGTDALYNGKLLTNSATIFLIRSGNGDTVSFTYKSVTGINAIGNYVQGEVDYVDLNDDGVADYVYIIAASDTAKAEGLFYYAGNNNYSYNTTTGYWIINGFMDGVDATLTVANDNFFDGISGYDTTHAGWVSKIVATSNRLYLVKTEDGLLSAEPVAYNTNDTQVTLDDDYSDAYTGKTPYVNVVADETGSKFDNNLLSMAAGQNFTTNESTKFVVDGKTAALPYSLTDYNVIIVWDRAKSTALQVYAYSKDTTKANTDIVYSVVARDNQVITATVNNGTLTIDQAKLVSSTNGAANVDATFTTATATVKFYDLAGNEVATRQAAVTPTVNGGGTASVISISVPTTLTPANYKVVVTLDNVKVGSDVVATSLSVFETVIGF